MAKRIDWPALWRAFNRWHNRQPSGTEWQDQRKEIRRLVEAQLKAKSKRKR